MKHPQGPRKNRPQHAAGQDQNKRVSTCTVGRRVPRSPLRTGTVGDFFCSSPARLIVSDSGSDSGRRQHSRHCHRCSATLISARAFRFCFRSKSQQRRQQREWEKGDSGSRGWASNPSTQTLPAHHHHRHHHHPRRYYPRRHHSITIIRNCFATVPSTHTRGLCRLGESRGGSRACPSSPQSGSCSAQPSPKPSSLSTASAQKPLAPRYCAMPRQLGR